MSRVSLGRLLTAYSSTVIFAVSLSAQGGIGLQGFGYPPGQLTVRAASTGGALAEFEQAGPHNPAALLNWGVAGAYVQYSPERRATTVNGITTNTSVARFPVFAIGLPAGQRYAFGISSSTLLERNFTLTSTLRQRIRNDSVTTTSTFTARGSMSDIQFGGAMQVRKWLRVGSAIHIITGENGLRTFRTLVADSVPRADTINYASITENSTATFSGSALSFGAELSPTTKLSIAGSARLGFRLRAELTDSTSRRADVPNRAGLAVRWDVGGTNLAARYNWEGWSAMRGLGDAATAFDSKEFGAGAEIPGPKIRGGQLLLRLGARRRDLPFGVAGVQPRESLFGGGVGLPLAFGRAQLDLGVERARRTVPGVSNLSERGILLSFGFRIRT